MPTCPPCSRLLKFLSSTSSPESTSFLAPSYTVNLNVCKEKRCGFEDYHFHQTREACLLESEMFSLPVYIHVHSSSWTDSAGISNIFNITNVMFCNPLMPVLLLTILSKGDTALSRYHLIKCALSGRHLPHDAFHCAMLDFPPVCLPVYPAAIQMWISPQCL